MRRNRLTVGLAAALATALVPAAPRRAAADRREASLHAHLIGGMASTGDAAATAGHRRATAPLGGVAVRASYATRNVFQYDAALAVLATGGADFRSGTFAPAGRPPVTGPFTVASQLTRLDAGITVRLGVAWIPTVRVAAGLAAHHRGAPLVDTGGATVSGRDATGRRGTFTVDATASAALGLDHRIHRRLIVGAALGVCVSAPSSSSSFHTLEATFHAAYYWYPR